MLLFNLVKVYRSAVYLNCPGELLNQMKVEDN